MKKSILEIYAMAVCFAAVVCFASFLGTGVYNIVQIIKPELTISSWAYEKHQSNDKFWEPTGYCDGSKTKKTRPSEEELTKQRLESYAKALRVEQRNAGQNLIVVVIVILITTVLFVIHWRIAKNVRKSSDSA